MAPARPQCVKPDRVFRAPPATRGIAASCAFRSWSRPYYRSGGAGATFRAAVPQV